MWHFITNPNVLKYRETQGPIIFHLGQIIFLSLIILAFNFIPKLVLSQLYAFDLY